MSVKHIRLIIMGLLAVFAGCKVGPNFRPPAGPELHARYYNAHYFAEFKDFDLSFWWTKFDDPVLVGLVDHAVAQNLDLQEAVMRIVEARAQRGVIRSGLFPTSDASSTYDYKQNSLNASQFVPLSSSPAGFDLYGAGLDATWQIDLFGQIRRSIEAADGEIGVRIESYRDVLITLLSDVATNYINVRLAQEQIEIAKANLKSQRKTLEVVQMRHRAGLVGKLDVAQAESIVYTTAAAVPALEERLQIALYRLSVLLGRTPNAELFDFIGDGKIPNAPVDLAVSIPANLLRQRPDIRSAEQDVVAENARIGVAVAEFYPKLTLLGDVAVDSRLFNEFFTPQSLAYAVGPSVRWNILSSGRTRNSVRAQRSRYQQSVVRYQQTVLKAVEEVEGGLVSIQREQQRADQLHKAVGAARDSLRLSKETYSKGLIKFQPVQDAQRQLLRLEEQLAQSLGTIDLNFVRTYKALGGGWGTMPWPEDAPVLDMPAAEPDPSPMARIRRFGRKAASTASNRGERAPVYRSATLVGQDAVPARRSR